MTRFGRLHRSQLNTISLLTGAAAGVIRGQLALFLILILYTTASAQENHGTDYIRSSQPPLLSYEELVTLSQQEAVNPALASKLQTLLTTPFINNEAYFSGIKPLRPDLKGLGPSLRLAEWNIERGLELDDIKLALTDREGFLAKAHAESNDKKKLIDKELIAQMEVLQSADVIVLNELDWGMKRTDYRVVVKELADALKMNWAYGVEFVEVDPKVLGLQSFANVKDEAERKELENLFSVDKPSTVRSLCSNVSIVDNALYRSPQFKSAERALVEHPAVGSGDGEGARLWLQRSRLQSLVQSLLSLAHLIPQVFLCWA